MTKLVRTRMGDKYLVELKIACLLCHLLLEIGLCLTQLRISTVCRRKKHIHIIAKWMLFEQTLRSQSLWLLSQKFPFRSSTSFAKLTEESSQSIEVAPNMEPAWFPELFRRRENRWGKPWEPRWYRTTYKLQITQSVHKNVEDSKSQINIPIGRMLKNNKLYVGDWKLSC